jgi:Methyltransferase domain
MAWDSIPGWCGFTETYDEMVATCPDGGTLCEIGVAFGRSLAYLSRRVIDSGKRRIKIYAVDPWWDDWWHVPEQYPTHIERPTWGGEHSQFGRDLGGPFSAFVHCMRTHAAEELERVNVLRCRSVDAAQFIGPCHGVLIDADHNYAAVAQDIALWRPHILPGGILAGDDWSERDFPGVCKAVREAFGEGQFETRGTTWIKRL